MYLSKNRTLKKVILQEFITLDGFVADRKGGVNFFDFLAGEGGREVDEDLLEFIGTIDTILLGANTYRMFVDFWPNATTVTEIVADRLNATPKIVFSKTLTKAPWGTWEDAKVVASDTTTKIEELKQGPGKDMVIWGSISLAQSLMKEKLIDEYELRICPVVLGDGLKLFPDDLRVGHLNLLETKTYKNGLVFLRYKSN
jgi:dihydrofolate reductase